jgi:tripartite-type tricarboxylate transporter receptor subunit TctC
VPYRGNAPGRQALAAGQIDGRTVVELSRGGEGGHDQGSGADLSARIDNYPDTPTTTEAGLPSFQASLWYGLWVRHGAPADVIKRLNAVMRETLADPEVAKKLSTLGIKITPAAKQALDDLRAFQKAEAERWWPIIKAANFKQQQ